MGNILVGRDLGINPSMAAIYIVLGDFSVIRKHIVNRAYVKEINVPNMFIDKLAEKSVNEIKDILSKEKTDISTYENNVRKYLKTLERDIDNLKQYAV